MPKPPVRRCEHCHGPIRILARDDAKTCSPRCRTALHRSRQPAIRAPRELEEQARWVRYNERKVPLTLAGKAASSTDPSTWTSYREAATSKVGAGPGFVLNGDRIVCVDLDHCLERGKLTPWAARILAAMPNTYVEVSPSGDGLHIWGLGDVGRGRRIPVAGGGSLEIYGRGRYITVTGKRFGSCPRRLAELPEAVTKLAA